MHSQELRTIKTIYEAKGTLSNLCQNSHISYLFYVEDELNEIILQFDYTIGRIEDEKLSQAIIYETIDRDSSCQYSEINKATLRQTWKNFTPIKNLLTLSLDDANGFRGAGHRGRDSETITISKEAATAGYIKGTIPKGNITITLSAHALVSPCEYHIQVYEGGERYA